MDKPEDGLLARIKLFFSLKGNRWGKNYKHSSYGQVACNAVEPPDSGGKHFYLKSSLQACLFVAGSIL